MYDTSTIWYLTIHTHTVHIENIVAHCASYVEESIIHILFIGGEKENLHTKWILISVCCACVVKCQRSYLLRISLFALWVRLRFILLLLLYYTMYVCILYICNIYACSSHLNMNCIHFMCAAVYPTYKCAARYCL